MPLCREFYASGGRAAAKAWTTHNVLRRAHAQGPHPRRGGSRRGRLGGAGHRRVARATDEAPRIMLDPTADNTDLYAFTAPDAPDGLTIVANWIPFEDPAGGPNFCKLDPQARLPRQGRQHRRRRTRTSRYQLAVPRPRSATRTRSCTRAPPVDSIDDPNLNFVQTYDLWKDATSTDGSSAAAGSATTCRSRPTTWAPRRCPTTRAWPPAPSAG